MMLQSPYTPPTYQASAFNCPYCRAYANHRWSTAYYKAGPGFSEVSGVDISHCTHCNEAAIWKNGELIEPSTSTAPMPNSDLPDEIKADYNEARTILNRSPRGAAALLRLCVQKLCTHLGEKGKNLNDDIAALVKQGLNARIQKSLDAVRVIGNEAVHPGVLDLKDDASTAVKLFQLINLIADALITHSKMVDELYEELPEEKLKQIEKRDNTE